MLARAGRAEPSRGRRRRRQAGRRQQRRACLRLDVASLVASRSPEQRAVQGLPAQHLGLGRSREENLALRRRLGLPGAPFSGMGFFDPQAAEPAAEGPGPAPPRGVTREVVRRCKLREFRACAEGRPSVYFWALQPIFSASHCCVGAEVLVRARNGADCAPFEDVQALMDPAAPEDVRLAYARWKAAEAVDWLSQALRQNPVLQRLSFVSVNLRPRDLDPEGMVFREVARRFAALAEQDRQLLRRLLCVEVTEDQEHPGALVRWLKAWRDLGFRFAHDDTIGDLACEALGLRGVNLHTTSALRPILEHFWLVKVDMEWAGRLLFLAHPSLAGRPAEKAEVLRRAREEDLVFVLRGQGLESTSVRHSAAVEEFVAWAKQMISRGKRICVELTVDARDENCAFALERCLALGLDVLGEHAAHFCFQGGPCGAKAFEAGELAGSARAEAC